jgi:hypothetical protein
MKYTVFALGAATGAWDAINANNAPAIETFKDFIAINSFVN